MTLTKDTLIQKCDECSINVLNTEIEFKSISEIKNLPLNTVLNVIGICYEIRCLEEITAKSGKEYKKRDVIIIDKKRGTVLHACPFCASTFQGRPENARRHAKERCKNYLEIKLLFEGLIPNFEMKRREDYAVETVPQNPDGRPLHLERPNIFLKEVTEIARANKLQDDPVYTKVRNTFVLPA